MSILKRILNEALSESVESGNSFSEVEDLLLKGAEADWGEKSGRRSVFSRALTSKNRNVDICRILLEKGADPDYLPDSHLEKTPTEITALLNDNRITDLFFEYSKREYDDKNNAEGFWTKIIRAAICSDNFYFIESLMKHKKISPDSLLPTVDETLLMLVAEHEMNKEKKRFFHRLLEFYRADGTLISPNGLDAFSLSIWCGNLYYAIELDKKYPDFVTAQIEKTFAFIFKRFVFQKPDKFNPNIATIQWLLDKGISKKVINEAFINSVINLQNENFAFLLLRYGADLNPKNEIGFNLSEIATQKRETTELYERVKNKYIEELKNRLNLNNNPITSEEIKEDVPLSDCFSR